MKSGGVSRGYVGGSRTSRMIGGRWDSINDFDWVDSGSLLVTDEYEEEDDGPEIFGSGAGGAECTSASK